MAYQYIGVTRDDAHPGVVTVTMNRPPVNALSFEMGREMLDAFQTLSADPDARCVILTGAGDRLFCAGADVKEISKRTTEVAIKRSEMFRTLFDAIRRCSVPTIAAVNGTAVGAGLVISSCCDIVIAAKGAQFSLPEITVGVMGGARHTVRMMPDKVMRYLAFTGTKISAEELQSLGEVREVLPRDALMPRAIELADGIASRSPSAVRLMKEAINLTEDMPLTEGYRVEQLFTTLASELPDAKEAALAFIEKRKPNF